MFHLSKKNIFIVYKKDYKYDRYKILETILVLENHEKIQIE